MNLIWKTLNEMLNDRGFIIKDDSHAYCNDEIIYIKIMDQKKIGKKEIINLLEQMNEEQQTHLILVIPQKLTPLAIQELKLVKDKYVEVFLYNELMFNITKHYTQPQIKMLTMDERKQIIQEIKVSQLPIIVKSDPVAKYFNAKPGSIFKFTRTSGIYYRIVV
jgi:DNA-directed RNA polymerase I, II, and III subunit RPABC1